MKIRMKKIKNQKSLSLAKILVKDFLLINNFVQEVNFFRT